MSSPHTDPQAELRALAAGLGSRARRARRAGRRRSTPTEAIPAPGQAPAAAVQPTADTTDTTDTTATTDQAASGARMESPSDTPIDSPQAVAAAAAACQDLSALRAAVSTCRACALCETRTQTVFADGDGSAGVLFIGEAPGANEDEQGVPFVGRAGKLLTDIITKGMNLDRKHVAIANILKCRPPDNRDPSAGEKRTCTPWLDRQIELLAPKVLIPLGKHASGHILSSDAAMGAMRGRVHELENGVRVVPTYHPAYLLRSPGQKKVCWGDIQLAMAELG